MERQNWRWCENCEERSAHVESEIRNRLSADHEQLEDIAKQVLAVFDVSERTQMRLTWGKLEAALHEHLEAEEKYAFPHLAADRRRDAQSLLAEHRHLRVRVTELGVDIEHGTIRREMIRDFIDELSAHSRHEERMLYR